MDAIQDLWSSFAGAVIGLLPVSPTIDSDALAVLSQYAGYVNWFFPVGKFLAFVGATLTVVGTYYLAMVILRMLRLIK